MDFGLQIFPTDRAIQPAELAREAEARGFESLFFPEHTHIPTSRRTPYPAGGDLPEEYWRSHDPFVALTAAAMATGTLRVATGVCLVAQRDPIVTAKQVASLDVVSGGRFVFGVGYGWNVEEMEDHGVDSRRRRDLVREKMLAMTALWADEEASFEGELVRFPPSWSWPKPVQRPRPPVLIGGAAGPTLFAHAAEWADGWIPIGGSGLGEQVPRLRQAFEEAGRDPASAVVNVIGARIDEGRLDRLASLGVSRVVLNLPPEPADTVLPLLDRYASAVAQATGGG